MNELDLLKQFRAEIGEPSTEAWQRARSAIAAASADRTTTRSPTRRLRELAVRYPRRPLAALAGIAGAAAAATIGALVLTAGTTPAAAQAFPILLTHATDIRDTDNVGSKPAWLGTLRAWLPEATAAAAAGDAHAAFSLPNGAGYVLGSPGGSTLCIVVIPTPPASTPAGSVVARAARPPTPSRAGSR